MEELNNAATTPITPEEQNGDSNEAVSWEDQLEESLAGSTLKHGELRQGIIIDRKEDGLVVDIGAKRDGFVPNEDLEDLEGRVYTIGEEVPVVVARFRDTDGNVELSISQALLQEDWLIAERLLADQSVYEANVLAANRGGLTIEFGALRGFIPMSQLIGFTRIRQASERHRRLRAMVGQTIMLKVIEVNRRRRRLILSQQAAAKEWRAARRTTLLEELEEGQIRRGRISQITDFGLFVNLGGLDGLVHISELSWGRIENPTEVYRPGQRVKVRVLSVDRERQRIALSIKALAPDPWETAPERYPIGCLTMGKVSQVVDFGSFIELEPGVEGLLHNSELRDFEQREELNTSEPVLVKVIRVEPERRRIGLSVRQVRPEEWEDWVIEQAEAEEAARLKAEEEAKEKAAAAEEQVLDEDLDEEQSVAVSAEAESTDEIVQPVVVDETAVSESADSEAQAAETEDEIVQPVVVDETAVSESDDSEAQAAETEDEIVQPVVVEETTVSESDDSEAQAAETEDEIVQPVVVEETAVSESDDSEGQASETEDEIISNEEVAGPEKDTVVIEVEEDPAIAEEEE